MNPTTTAEINRINELVQLEILDTPKEREFDDIVELASKLCGTPISLISLVDVNRQWFKAKKGLDVSETDRSASFCAHALLQNDLMVVNDATQDQRFVSNPLVTGDPNIRFYAGAPILSPNGYKLGTLCIIDRQPKELSWQEASTLKMLSLQVAKLIELHYKKIQINILEEKLALQEMETQKVLRQKEHLNRLCGLENKGIHAFLTHQLEPLKSGKFTKKEVSHIHEQAQQKAQQVHLFNEALGMVSQLQSPPTPFLTTSFSINILAQEVLNNLQPLIKAYSNKTTVYIPEALTLQQLLEPTQLIIKTLLHAVLTTIKKKEMQLIAMEYNGGVEWRLSLVDTDLRVDFCHALQPPTDTATIPPTTDTHMELALTRELILQLGGKIEVNQLGNEGTTILLHLPHRS